MKKCTKCNDMLQDDAFGTRTYTLVDGTIKTSLRSMCNACRIVYHRERYRDNEQARDAMKAAAYRGSIKLKYGLTIETLTKMRKAQGFKCYVCGTPEEESQHGKLYIDHCHTTGRVRKLLCQPCNIALGVVKEDPEVLSRLIAYIKEHNGQKTSI